MHPNLLDQIAVFRTVADLGSFADAARRLNRRVSAVSYAITNLETHLGLTLIDRSGYRAGMTPEGRALLADIDVLLRRVERLEGRADAIRRAVETSLTLVVEHSVPPDAVARALANFESGFADVPLTLRVADTADVLEQVREGRADIGVAVLDRGLQWTDVDGAQVLADEILLVSAPDHPLAETPDAVELEALEYHRQIYLASGDLPEKDAPQTDYRIHRTDVWRAGDLATQIAVIEAGTGWGYVPRSAAARSIEAGRLVMLMPSAMRHLPYRRFAAFWRTQSPPGPAASALVAALGMGGEAIKKAGA